MQRLQPAFLGNIVQQVTWNSYSMAYSIVATCMRRNGNGDRIYHYSSAWITSLKRRWMGWFEGNVHQHCGCSTSRSVMITHFKIKEELQKLGESLQEWRLELYST